ncbi:MAG: Gnt-II system L-idonate transporter, partial [Pirellulales bacterium]|nr:Gnt-II system L-idonate transporter [Pirellulales bacterium]
LPVVLPVCMILSGTVAVTLADAEDRARLRTADIASYSLLADTFATAAADSPAGRVLQSRKLSEQDQEILRSGSRDGRAKQSVVKALNKALSDVELYDPAAFSAVDLRPQTLALVNAEPAPVKPVEIRRLNRMLLEDAYPGLVIAHQWESPRRHFSNKLALWSNSNFALLVAALVAMLTVKYIRRVSWRRLGHDVEMSLMSGGVIILITAAGGAFGAMLSATNISDTIRASFADVGASGIGLLALAFGIAAVLKVAQGSSTVAMIIGAGMMSAIIGNSQPPYHLVYVATAVGSGSLLGSWMNDSGFWVFAKMSGLTESESLRSWTPLLVVLSMVGFGMTVLLSQMMPLRVEI